MDDADDYDPVANAKGCYDLAVATKRDALTAQRRPKTIQDVEIIHGDCRDALRELIDEGVQVDSCVTDPPYALLSIHKRFAKVGRNDKTWSRSGPHQRTARGFMGKAWDTGDAAHDPALWALVLQCLKPGGHLLAFGGTRTSHRMVFAIEDAGFEIRDSIAWVYGSGFPKSHDAGDGWGTALKPAIEPVCLARRPLIGTVTVNLGAHGVGAINIDGCRVGDFVNTTLPGTDRYNQANFEQGYRPGAYQGAGRVGEASATRRYSSIGSTNFAALPGPRGGDAKGRWPANLIHDGSDEVLDAFPVAPGQLGRSSTNPNSPRTRSVYGNLDRTSEPMEPRNDTGSAARFFYCAKASKTDRSGSKHPTVKPIALMRYLCRLVTPPRGIVLDPFAGSGSTLQAAFEEGFRSIGIEREAEYVADIERRVESAKARRRVELLGE